MGGIDPLHHFNPLRLISQGVDPRLGSAQHVSTPCQTTYPKAIASPTRTFEASSRPLHPDLLYHNRAAIPLSKITQVVTRPSAGDEESAPRVLRIR